MFRADRLVKGTTFDSSLVSVDVVANKCNFELHYIFCQGACFVCEHVLDLPQFLVESGGLGSHSLSPFWTVHEPIGADGVCLENLHKLDGDNQRDGDESAHQYDIAQEHHSRILKYPSLWPVDIVMTFLMLLPEQSVKQSGKETDRHLEQEYTDEQSVETLLKM